MDGHRWRESGVARRPGGEAPDEQWSQCGAKLVPMWAAPEYLDDEGWVEQIGEEARAELEDA